MNHSLPTAQREAEPSSVLQRLRSLRPCRAMTTAEALTVAERQAVTLLSLQDVTSPAVPVEVITELPRLRLAYDETLPVSGSAYWDGQAWVITLNATEPLVRQRFSLLHEFKHVLDHPTKQLFTSDRGRSAEQQHELLADFFAASVLMPRMWVKRAWFGGLQDLPALAERFEVSEKAMTMRLDFLGLRSSGHDRCLGRATYRRQASGPVNTPIGMAA